MTPPVTAADMVFPGAQWEQVEPESQGFDAAKLETAVQFLAQYCGADGVSQLLVVRNGRVIWRGRSTAAVHGVWSCTKSFSSTVLGLLLDDGKCRLDDLAARYLPVLEEHYPAVTLRHFTTMTSGYRAVNDEPVGTYTHGPSSTPFDPNPEPLFAPGTKYAYWDSAMNQFANVLTHIAGEPIAALFRRGIAEPIGMDPEQWRWGEFGEVDGLVVNGGSGNADKHVFVSADQMARFGHLFLNRGSWNGRQLLSAEWIATATSVQVPADLPMGHTASGIDGPGVYGCNWWVNGVQPDGHRRWPGAPVGTFAATGFNNNRLFVIPEWRMVIVRLGLDGDTGKPGEPVYQRLLRMIGEARQK